ncbi:MAG: penicillin-binding protein [Chloroflexi bacterium]|nr:penicillin-binding protein [Chloroflexota bacterium]
MERLRDSSGAAAGAPAAPSILTPEERVLAQKFHDTEDRVRDLRRMLAAGQIDRAQFEQHLRQSMVLDDARVYWMLGTESDRWYKYENGQWLPATPPVLEKEAAAAGGVSGLGASAVFDGDQTMPTSTLTDEAWVPRQVPIQDPEATLPGTGGIFLNADQATVPSRVDLEATVPGRAYTEVTIPSTPVNQQFDSVAAVQVPAPPAADVDLYQEAVDRQRRNTARTIAIVAAIAAGLIFIIGTIVVIGTVLYYNNLADPYRQAIAALANYQPQFQTARILAADGSVIAELTSQQGGARTKISLSQMAPEIIHAIVSIENERYFEDPGFDLIAIFRAFVQNLTAGGVESGASTITQQIARGLILQDTTVSAQRKLQEIVVAAEIARQYDKNFILELYMNEFFFGNQSYGIEAASEFYFRHTAADLNLAESALLAGLIQAPARYDPVINREAAFARMNEVLNQQARVGCLQFQHAPYNQQPFCVTQSQITSPQVILQKARVETAQYLPRESRVQYPHFVNYIQQRVEADFGTNEIFRRGLQIRTTLIPGLQRVAESALQQQVQALSINGINTGTVMVTDPRTGAILAMVGSPNFNDETIAGQVNNAFTWQQAGSAIKPAVYTAALEGVDINGVRSYYTPATILWDVPVTYEGTPPYAPVNYDRTFHGPQGLRYALANSYNVPAVKTYAFIGNDRFRETAERMGLRFLPEATFSLASALGANDVRLYDMMQMYGTLANNGVRTPLTAITSIRTSDGQEVPLPSTVQVQSVQAVQPQIAYLLQSILSDNQARTPAFGANSPLNIAGYAGQVAAKTGTSNDNRDLWTMGFSRTMVVGVWIGRHDNGPTVNTSGLAAAPIWNAVMSTALAGTQPGAFTPPQGIVQQQVCVETGTTYDPNNVTPGCRSVRTEFFVANSPPQAASDSFVQTVAIDTWSGLRANQFCPDNRETRTFANISDSSAVAWLQTPAGQGWLTSLGLPTGLPPAPAAECDQNTVNPQVRFTNLSEGQQLTGLVAIQGIVTGPNFQSFRVEVAPATAPNSWELVGGPFAAQQPGGTLVTWDTTTKPNGAYTLRIVAQATNNGTAIRTVNVGLNNQPTPTPTVPMPTLIIPTFDPGSTPIPFQTPIPFGSTVVPMGGLSQLAPTPTIDFN